MAVSSGKQSLGVSESICSHGSLHQGAEGFLNLALPAGIHMQPYSYWGASCHLPAQVDADKGQNIRAMRYFCSQLWVTKETRIQYSGYQRGIQP